MKTATKRKQKGNKHGHVAGKLWQKSGDNVVTKQRQTCQRTASSRGRTMHHSEACARHGPQPLAHASKWCIVLPRLLAVRWQVCLCFVTTLSPDFATVCRRHVHVCRLFVSFLSPFSPQFGLLYDGTFHHLLGGFLLVVYAHIVIILSASDLVHLLVISCRVCHPFLASLSPLLPQFCCRNAQAWRLLLQLCHRFLPHFAGDMSMFVAFFVSPRPPCSPVLSSKCAYLLPFVATLSPDLV